VAQQHQGPRVARRFDIPVELDEWLEARARPAGPDSYCPTARSKNATVTLALYLLRELTEGIPSPASTAVMDEALADLEAMARGMIRS